MPTEAELPKIWGVSSKLAMLDPVCQREDTFILHHTLLTTLPEKGFRLVRCVLVRRPSDRYQDRPLRPAYKLCLLRAGLSGLRDDVLHELLSG